LAPESNSDINSSTQQNKTTKQNKTKQNMSLSQLLAIGIRMTEEKDEKLLLGFLEEFTKPLPESISFL